MQDASEYWDRFFAPYRVRVPASFVTGRARPAGRRLGPGVGWDARGFWDRHGESWTVVTRVPLGMPHAQPEDCELWLANCDSSDRYQTVDPSTIDEWRGCGLEVLPALVTSTNMRLIRACIVPTERDLSSWPLHRYPAGRIRGGEVDVLFIEGGPELRGYALPDPTPEKRKDFVLDSVAVRRAIGCDLRRLTCRDATDVRLGELSVTGDAMTGFRVQFTAIGAVVAIPGQKHSDRMKTVTLEWSRDDGDPREWLVTHLEQIDLMPGSEEWFP